MKTNKGKANHEEEVDFRPETMKRLPRGSFLASSGDTANPRKTKVRVTLYLDSDILAYFKGRALQPNAAAYQTQINNELRAVMEQEVEMVTEYASLIEDPQFIAAVAEKVQAYQTQHQ